MLSLIQFNLYEQDFVFYGTIKTKIICKHQVQNFQLRKTPFRVSGREK